MFKAKGPICQSCSMPLSRDEKGGGTEVDGTLSTEYCSYCYSQGAFTQSNMTSQDMMKLVEDKMSEIYIPRFLGRFFARQIPKLKRWKNERHF